MGRGVFIALPRKIINSQKRSRAGGTYGDKWKGLYPLPEMQKANEDKGAPGNNTEAVSAVLPLVQERADNRQINTPEPRASAIANMAVTPALSFFLHIASERSAYGRIKTE